MAKKRSIKGILKRAIVCNGQEQLMLLRISYCESCQKEIKLKEKLWYVSESDEYLCEDCYS